MPIDDRCVVLEVAFGVDISWQALDVHAVNIEGFDTALGSDPAEICDGVGG